MNGKKSCIFFALFLFLGLSACGVKTDENSPMLESASIFSSSGGSVDSQYVSVVLEFDREVSVSREGSLRVTISGNRIRDYELAQGENPSSAVLTIPVEAVTKGVLYVGRDSGSDCIADIASADGKSAAADFTVQGVIPSGVTLETVERTEGRVTKEVTSAFQIRSIAWVGLWEDGELVPVSETREGEQLDGCAAVHGHEFLIDEETDVAENIAAVLAANYGSEYSFTQDGSRITAEKAGSSAALDICIYEYLEVNDEIVMMTEPSSEMTSEETAEHTGTDEHEKNADKITDEDREILPEEQALLDLLRSDGLSQTGLVDGTVLYQTVTMTGDALSETQIYAVIELEELLRLSYVNSAMHAISLPLEAEGYYGLDFAKFLSLCGVDLSSDELYITLGSGADGAEKTLPLQELTGDGVTTILALSNQDGPLEDGGPICLVWICGGETEIFPDLQTMCIGYEEIPENTEDYGYHNREPYLSSQELTFTVEVYQAGAEYLGALQTAVFTTVELESLMQEYPEAVLSGYYGTVGNEEIFPYEGTGGYLDHFDGLDLYWLLTEQVGIENLSGYAELYDRDGELYSEIDDLTYLAEAHEHPEEYYTLSRTGVKITGMIPMIATVKNGAPILPDHTHDIEGYIAYNTLSSTLEELGVSTEVGVVKNHNGPFILCLGNREGYYGGAQVETGNNCVTMRLYLN